MLIRAKENTRLCIPRVYIGLLRQMRCEGRSPLAVNLTLPRSRRLEAVIRDPHFDINDLKKQSENALKIEEERAKLQAKDTSISSEKLENNQYKDDKKSKSGENNNNNSKLDAENVKKIYPHYHLLVEIYKFMTAKRGLMADPKYIKNPKHLIYDIIDKDTAKEIAKKINLNQTLPEKEYGFTGTAIDDHGTTHLNVTDKDGNFVLITSTINLEFGAKFMCQKTGIIFNDEIDDFYVTNVKNEFELAGMRKNIIEPGKRPFSSASPLLLEKNNETIALGAAGGTRIPTSIIGVLFHMILGKSLSEAIAELRIHNQFYPNKTYIEAGFEDDLIAYLNYVGHHTEESALNAIFTSVQGLHVVKNGNYKIIEASSDKRKGGLAYGY
ncbi:regulatory factor X [Binucleata daphniae]